VPVICFGVVSGVAAPISRRFGEERVLGSAVTLLAAGLVLRAAVPHALLFVGTVITSCAIALMNVLLPSLVKRRSPERAGLLIGLYLLALAAGAIVASLIAVPVFEAVAGGGGGGSGAGGGRLVGGLVGGGNGAARLTLGLWAIPALIAAAAWLPQLRFRTLPGPAAALDAAGGEDRPRGGRPRSGRSRGGRPRSGLSMIRSALAWQVTAFMGLQSLTFYAALSWFPTLFRDRGVSAVHAGDLLALMNFGNAFTAMLFPVLAHRTRDHRVLVAAAILASTVGLAGSAFGPLAAAAPLMFVLGLGQGAALGLSIFLFTARARDPAASASLSGFAQGAGYLIASMGPLLIGLLHTATGGWSVPVWALLAVTSVELVTGWLAGRDRTVG
jgi:MFS transporter, CP family, cyanate transporter